MAYEEYNVIKELQGKTFTKVEKNDEHLENDIITFHKSTSNEFKEDSVLMFHERDCCESVWIESIVGDLSDLENTPILLAEEVVSRSTLEEDEANGGDTSTYTFYKLRTIKGSVDIRWVGTSNGYYSETVSIKEYLNFN